MFAISYGGPGLGPALPTATADAPYESPDDGAPENAALGGVPELLFGMITRDGDDVKSENFRSRRGGAAG